MAACTIMTNILHHHEPQKTEKKLEKPIDQCLPDLRQCIQGLETIVAISSIQLTIIAGAMESCVKRRKQYGIHSVMKMEAGGFYYTGERDEAKCHTCQLVVVNWTADMDPFTIHAQHRPTCSFVKNIRPDENIFIPTKLNLPIIDIMNNDQENRTKRLKVDGNQNENSWNTLAEVDLLKQMRKRTFSHWPHRASPSSAQMIEAGLFNCNVGDRTICLYCNMICQQWTPNTDDPWEVHQTISPKCPYVIATLKQRQTASIRILNELSTNGTSAEATNTDPLRLNEVVFTAACNPAYIEIPRRHASFATWPSENMPSVDDLVRAGFFYTGTKTIVTCFYCNGSLQNWGANDNPMIEHARWFPNCAYAKQLCGSELYRKIQESKRAQQGDCSVLSILRKNDDCLR